MPKIVRKTQEQSAAEADVEAFHDNRGPFVVAAEETRMAMVFTDATEPASPIIFANDSFLALTGYSREEVLGQSFDFLLAHAADASAKAELASQFDGETNGGAEVLYRRKDGTEFWAGVFISPVHDKKGRVVQHFASFVDLTKHKDRERQSQMLIDELNHRVKNTLATVQSIVWQALRSTSDPAAIREAIESRLFALSRSHDLLTREKWESASLRHIVEEALAPFSNGRTGRMSLKGKAVRFPPQVALALGIAFNELATNAAKYGAFSNSEGSITVAWSIKSTKKPPMLVIRWEEKGGPKVARPSRKGFGSRVLERGLSHELGGEVTLDYRVKGLVCTIAVPMPRTA